MKTINELTKKQKAQMKPWADKWVSKLLKDKPNDVLS